MKTVKLNSPSARFEQLILLLQQKKIVTFIIPILSIFEKCYLRESFETQNGHSYYATKQISTIDPSDAATTYPAPVFLSFTPSSSAPYSTMAEEDFNPAGYNVIFVMLQTS